MYFEFFTSVKNHNKQYSNELYKWMRMTNIDVSIIIVNYDITSLVVNAIDSLFHKIKDLTIEIIVISNVSNDISPPSPKSNC